MAPRRELKDGNLQCAHCALWRPENDFPRCLRSKVGRNSYCRDCVALRRGTKKRVEQYPEGTKRCVKCRDIKSFDNFYATKKGRFGLSGLCKPCTAVAQREFRAANPTYAAEVQKRHRLANPEKVAARQKVWREKNQDHVNARNKQKYAESPQFKLSLRLRNRLNKELRRGKLSVSGVRDLGGTVDAFKTYLESKFQEGMTWDNWGNGLDDWHIDHIRPFASFDLTDATQVRQACHFSNMQPLWARDNRKKGNRWLLDSAYVEGL